MAGRDGGRAGLETGRIGGGWAGRGGVVNPAVARLAWCGANPAVTRPGEVAGRSGGVAGLEAGRIGGSWARWGGPARRRWPGEGSS
ncbi:hypothetical protein FHX82_000915 [Amycolatopsis bartoniae]|uniref:hypothetical protein n=1 Tax=Amycolatopsis bartoniae TaxID=941986 RepID=UPI001606F22E|nr:hypothetical protein [Amycolatopsis bartoniae]MBB2933895.1 hypothetical protein [Amycolatopsis bartoniae]